MLTITGVEDRSTDDRISGLLRTMLAIRPEKTEFSPWGSGQTIDPVMFTGQLCQLQFGLAQANNAISSGLR
jgi:hypothetical protein